MRAPHPLSDEKLRRLSTQRLLEVLKLARRWASLAMCESCGESLTVCVGVSEEDRTEWKKDQAEADAYEARIKALLATRPHLERRA